MQRLLRYARWDADAVHDGVRAYVVDGRDDTATDSYGIVVVSGSKPRRARIGRLRSLASTWAWR